LRTEDCIIAVGSDKLVATKIYADSGRPPTMISFHGTGAATDRRRVRYLFDYLAGQGISSMCFDFSGHGESTGSMHEATLNLRLKEARAAATLLGDGRPRAIIGSSMGGYLAAVLAPILHADILVLICPAAYPNAAMDLKFGEDFYTVAREPGAYIGSPAFEALAGFRGSLLIIGGRNDTVIPKEVVELYFESAPLAKFRKLIWLEEADHGVHVWLEQHENDRERILPEIVALVTE
jgi:pimeloyl-ACP methyl ester carboxylesterase